MSWRHCYKAFYENRNKTDEQTLDYLSLHLAFYLASWRIYRGSSFLLQKRLQSTYSCCKNNSRREI